MIVGYTPADLARAKADLLRDEKEMSMGGRKLVRHSMAEKRALVDAIAAELAITNAPVQPRFPRAVQIVVDL